MFLFSPKEFLDPCSCSNTKWINTKKVKMNGSRKCSEQNRVKVGSLTENPPQIHFTRSSPIIGTTEKRFVITATAQYDICPQGRT